MDFFFADDARQNNPSRDGMGQLVAAGGIYVPGDSVYALERDLDKLCSECGFPPKEEFKWSPGRELWMRENLVDVERQDFFFRAIESAKLAGAKAVVVVVDSGAEHASHLADSAETDATILLLERANSLFTRNRNFGVIVTDRPGGDRRDEMRFLASCLEVLEIGTEFVNFNRTALNVLSTPSKLVRLVQLADLITSCTLFAVSGEDVFAPPVFEHIRDFLDSSGRIGGYGLKIHPDYTYVNLYHWICGDSLFMRGSTGHPMPLEGHPYSKDPNVR